MRPTAAISVLLLALLTLQAAAQTTSRLPNVAVLNWHSQGAADRLAPFHARLRELGWVEGRNVRLEVSYANESTEQAGALAAEIVVRRVDIIVAITSPAAEAARKATSTIPIVIAVADALGTGLVTNLARPGGNVTGFSSMMPDLDAKRVELLREILPSLKSIAFLGSARDPATQVMVHEARTASEKLDIRFSSVMVRAPTEIVSAFSGISRDKFDAVVVQSLLVSNLADAVKIADIAIRSRLPVITTFSILPRAGGLISYGPHPEWGRRKAADYVDRILRGAKPSDLPVQQPTRFELAINLKTAKALGIDVPPMLLARADEVIE